ncbi:MAG: lysine--tRNA ligase [Candidatus Liptonbacteria bacterium]|nr:lysine--tRNA ligase [Candidatus Liptonbacteria bacterium]
MLEDLIAERRKKLEALKAHGVEPYPVKVPRTHSVAEAKEKFASLSKAKKKVSLVGRVMSIRDQGKIVFLDLRNESGSIQAVLKEESLKDFEFWRTVLDRGDFLSVTGPLFVTKRGEQSVEAKALTLASKSLRPMPSTWYGVEDVETRLRERYLDIFFSEEARELFRKKAGFWDTIRNFLKKEGFLEVETPVFEIVPGGAEAEPFITHHNALDADFYLRISLELPLKKLMASGYEKVFEIGRIFRNEGIDREHLQDYTQLEFYWAYRDYHDLMKITEALFKETIKKVTGGLTTMHQGKKIEWGKKWKKIEYCEVFQEANGLDPRTANVEELRAKAQALKIALEPGLGRGRLIDLIYKKTVRPNLIQPGFLVNPPVAIEPLAKRMAEDPERVERFQVVAGATELAKGFSELNDPLDQRARFEEQMKLREAGDTEAQMIDEEFLRAMEYGFPPIAGFGLSERLFAFLMDKPLRETVIYPLMRHRKNES